MNTPWDLSEGRVLVFSDAHQDLRWIEKILEVEHGNYDTILFNGDIAHTHENHEGIVGIRKSAKFYKWLLDKHHVNLGNHELPLMESWHRNSQFKNVSNPVHRMSGWTKSSTLHFNREMPSWNDWMKTSIFRTVHGWLVSHAGFTSDYWIGERSGHYNLERLWALSQDAKIGLATGVVSSLFRVGTARLHNTSPIKIKGGPLWLDWNDEFDASVPYKQLVGHTSELMNLRMRHGSYNIDGQQSIYAIISDTSIKFKFAHITKKGTTMIGAVPQR